ncbi:hypothetical protein RFI_00640 [Reticulomyxa filosa]|uniref:Uncharacterized protein n=1 Tax=Reticulomyxa filosa TaxID=46433 RepID=X6PD70_RETFI|nr:hypothetical protein RFI_00640 [Reticulomyxa filosa]|eukprot:ETO36415.1 hypothetical protein RFI_00640 [Reticulomyxa filosa]
MKSELQETEKTSKRAQWFLQQFSKVNISHEYLPSFVEVYFLLNNAFIEMNLWSPIQPKRYLRREKTRETTVMTNNLLRCDLLFLMATFVYSPNEGYYETMQQFIQSMVVKYIGDEETFESGIVGSSGLQWDVSLFSREKINEQYVAISENKEWVEYAMAPGYMDHIFVNAMPVFEADTGIHRIDILVRSKGDEMWMGLFDFDKFLPLTFPRCQQHTLMYYGGRESSITKTWDSEIWDDSDDGPAGSIQTSKQLVKRGLPHYTSGDWLSFIIDTNARQMTIYNNLRYICSVENAFPEGDKWLFCVCLDWKTDRIFIERAFYCAQWNYNSPSI